MNNSKNSPKPGVLPDPQSCRFVDQEAQVSCRFVDQAEFLSFLS